MDHVYWRYQWLRSSVDQGLIDTLDENPGSTLRDTWSILHLHSINTSVDTSWLIVSQELTNFLSFHMNRSTLSWLSNNYWSGDWVSTEYWSGCLSSTEPDVDQGYLESIMSSWESVKSSWFCRFMKPITTAFYLIILQFSPMHFSFIF